MNTNAHHQRAHNQGEPYISEKDRVLSQFENDHNRLQSELDNANIRLLAKGTLTAYDPNKGCNIARSEYFAPSLTNLVEIQSSDGHINYEILGGWISTERARVQVQYWDARSRRLEGEARYIEGMKEDIAPYAGGIASQVVVQAA